MESNNYIRMSEVRHHTSPESLWFVIHDVVYNVSNFLDQHPGGLEPLMEHAGQDATVAFEDVGHSEGARLDLKKYKVGDLHPEDIGKKSTLESKLLKIAVATLMVGIVFGILLRRYHSA